MKRITATCTRSNWHCQVRLGGALWKQCVNFQKYSLESNKCWQSIWIDVKLCWWALNHTCRLRYFPVFVLMTAIVLRCMCRWVERMSHVFFSSKKPTEWKMHCLGNKFIHRSNLLPHYWCLPFDCWMERCSKMDAYSVYLTILRPSQKTFVTVQASNVF